MVRLFRTHRAGSDRTAFSRPGDIVLFIQLPFGQLFRQWLISSGIIYFVYIVLLRSLALERRRRSGGIASARCPSTTGRPGQACLRGAHSTAHDADRQLVREVLNEFHVIRVLSLNTANEVVGDGHGPLASSRFEVRNLWT